MLEELWYNDLFKLGRIFDDKGLAVFGPTGDRGVTAVNHVVRFCWNEDI